MVIEKKTLMSGEQNVVTVDSLVESFPVVVVAIVVELKS